MDYIHSMSSYTTSHLSQQMRVGHVEGFGWLICFVDVYIYIYFSPFLLLTMNLLSNVGWVVHIE